MASATEPDMLRNYFRLVWRSMGRNKIFSFINILGLSISLAGAFLIFIWIFHEVSFDRFHKEAGRLYEVYRHTDFNGDIRTLDMSPEPLGPDLKSEFPEVEKCSRYAALHMVFQHGQSPVEEFVAFVDPDFLSMFSFPLVKGDKDEVFKTPNSIVLTESAAVRLFGSLYDAMGKSVEIDHTQKIFATVTGIIHDFPSNTKFQADALLDWKMHGMLGYKDLSPHAWTNGMVNTYVLLKPGADLKAFNGKIVHLAHRKDPMTEAELFLYPSSQWHLYNKFEDGKVSGGRIDRVYMFGAIAVLILLIACINFMNLSTARCEKRVREVGIRKTAGASKGMLVAQFIFESLVFVLLSAFISLLLVCLTLKPFEQLLSETFVIPLASPWLWCCLAGFILATGLLAGSYPGFYLASFRPVKVLKGAFFHASGGFNPRKILVVLQFTAAMVLIAATFIIRQQIHFSRDRDIGYDNDRLISVSLHDMPATKAEYIRQEILAKGIATSVTKTKFPMTYSYNTSTGIEWEGKDPNLKVVFHRYSVDAHWVRTTGVKLIAGRDIDVTKFPSDSSAIMLNEAAVKAMGFSRPIGERVFDNDIWWTVVGVVQDFVINSPYDKVAPMLIEGPKSYLSMMTMRLNGRREVGASLALLRSIFHAEDPEDVFDYQFADEDYAAKFKEENQVAVLTAIFSTMAIIISCLGLFALASFMAERRRKEIGIRKVLGASAGKIYLLISSEFLKLVAVSFVIAIPLCFYIMQRWLSNFSYRTSISADVFVFTGLLAFLIAVFTVSYHVFKAATANPVKSLRLE